MKKIASLLLTSIIITACSTQTTNNADKTSSPTPSNSTQPSNQDKTPVSYSTKREDLIKISTCMQTKAPENNQKTFFTNFTKELNDQYIVNNWSTIYKTSIDKYTNAIKSWGINDTECL